MKIINFRDRGIRAQLVLINSAFVILLLGLLTAIFLRYAKNELVDNIRKDSITLSAHLARDSVLPLLARDRKRIESYLEGVLGGPEVAYCAVYFSDGELFLKKNREGYEAYGKLLPQMAGERGGLVRELTHGDFPIMEASVPVLLEKMDEGREELGLSDNLFFPAGGKADVIGYTVVGLSAENLIGRYLFVSYQWVFIALALSILGIGAISFVIKRFVRPLVDLSKVASHVAGGELNVQIDVKSGGEVGALAGAFKHMIDSIKESINQIKERAREIEDLAEGAMEGIFFLDKDFRIIRENQEMARILKYERDELIGQSITMIAAADSADKLSEILDSGQSTMVEINLVAKNGIIIPFEVNFTPVTSGSSLGVLCFARDITEKKKMIDSLTKSKREISAIFDGITDYIWAVDLDCTVVRANKMFARKVGGKVGEIVGRNCKDIIFIGEDFCSKACPINEYRKKGVIHDAVEYRDKPSGRIYQMRTFPLLSESESLKGGINYLKDVTDTKAIEERLIQAERLAATGRLAANVAHEVNNPLGIIKNYLTLLQRDMSIGDSEIIENVDVINDEISRIAEIIKGLLVFSRPEPRGVTSCNINKTINDIVSLVRKNLEKHGIAVVLDFDYSIPDIKVSSGHLKQIMINLINNSQDAMPDGGDLKIKTSAKNGNIIVQVDDSGVGIKQSDMKELFNPFYTTKGVKGTGLGLSVSYGIIKGYGGDITLNRKKKGGVKARVFLPYGKKKEDANG
ncbi:MAG: PAS domain-containing protein [Deltaproteobacteria bacterium]|nr:PAS domain-containing protein [Deltaproteobacteria bacterium]